MTDQPLVVWASKSELEKRLLADTCELCGSQERITIHHIRALKDLHQKGRRDKPHWMTVMASRKRKTLVVCWACHMNIHHGHPANQPKPRNGVSLESRVHRKVHARFGGGRMEKDQQGYLASRLPYYEDEENITELAQAIREGLLTPDDATQIMKGKTV
jgi:hypothetical protein